MPDNSPAVWCGAQGPVIGAKMAAENKREFSPEVLKAGEAVVGLQAGTSASPRPTARAAALPAGRHDGCRTVRANQRSCCHC